MNGRLLIVLRQLAFEFGELTRVPCPFHGNLYSRRRRGPTGLMVVEN